MCEQSDPLTLYQALPGGFERSVQACRALEKRYADGRVRAIGVSNFMPEHLGRLRTETEMVFTIGSRVAPDVGDVPLSAVAIDPEPESR